MEGRARRERLRGVGPRPGPSHSAFSPASGPRHWQRTLGHRRVCAGIPGTCEPREQSPPGPRRNPNAMRALSGLLGARAPTPRLLLLLQCLLATARPSSAADSAPDSLFTSPPVREEMMEKYSNFSLGSHNISLTEHSSMPVEKNITLERPSNIKLTCQFTTSGDLNAVNVTWKKDGELLENNYLVNATGTTLYTQYRFTIINSKQMGSYSCFFQEEKEQKGTFNFKVPELHGKNKPLISYVGDSTVLTCKCQNCVPLNWTWYRSNGSVQVPVGVQMNKYVINETYANETKLKIKQLLEEDGGSYWCRALFQLGESEGHVELVVLSYLVPLKPFFAIVAEVVLLVAIILLCEKYTQKNKKHSDEEREFEQIEQLKSDDSNGIENNVPRLRKNESTGQ
uniref:Embigin n=2 Tax=Callithrix jacchus TaxID=9483 RepID=F6ZMI2_CALJA|nr:embigin isoform X2 [Callithrix jacchus]